MRSAIELRNNPTAVCLSRQKLPFLNLTAQQQTDCAKGGYILREGKNPKYIIFATGSEVSLAQEVAEQLGEDNVRIVSLPCWKLFDKQSAEYKSRVVSPEIANRISIEAGVTLGWQRFVGENGMMVGVDHFGDSAPAGDLAKEYGFTAEAVCSKIEQHFR